MIIALLLGILPPLWHVQQSVDPISDRRDVMAVINQNGNRLAIGCSVETNGAATVLFESSAHLAITGVGAMAFRFDGRQAQRATVIFSGRQIQIERATESSRFVDQLLRSTRLVIQVFDYNGVAHNAVFDLPANQDSVRSALAACGPFENI